MRERERLGIASINKFARFAGILLLGAGLIYLGAEAVTASFWQTPEYSYARNYISDLGVAERIFYAGHAIYSPLHAVMNTGFVLHGLLFMLGAVLGAANSRMLPHPGTRSREYPVNVTARLYLGFAVLHAIGMSLVGLFPENVSELHAVGAGLAIGFGNLAIVLGGWKVLRPLLPAWLPDVSLILGSLGLVSFAFLLLLMATSLFPGLLAETGGAIERISVYTISLWDFLVGIALLGRKAQE